MEDQANRDLIQLKIDMEMKKLRRQGKNGFEKSGMFTKAQMDAAKKRINEMLKEK